MRKYRNFRTFLWGKRIHDNGGNIQYTSEVCPIVCVTTTIGELDFPVEILQLYWQVGVCNTEGVFKGGVIEATLLALGNLVDAEPHNLLCVQSGLRTYANK